MGAWENWIPVGTVTVDSGTVMLADPGYHLGDDATHRTRNWLAVCERTFANGPHQVGASHGTPIGTIVEPWGGGAGLLFSTLHGDGRYVVEALLKNNRVAAVRIDFTDPQWSDDDDDDDDDDDVCDCGCEDGEAGGLG